MEEGLEVGYIELRTRRRGLRSLLRKLVLGWEEPHGTKGCFGGRVVLVLDRWLYLCLCLAREGVGGISSFRDLGSWRNQGIEEGRAAAEGQGPFCLCDRSSLSYMLDVLLSTSCHEYECCN